MMPIRHCLTLTLGALQRNRLQTALAIIGMGVGVGALVTRPVGDKHQQAVSPTGWQYDASESWRSTIVAR